MINHKTRDNRTWNKAIASLVLAAVPLLAQAQINVIGANTCGQWTAERAKGADGATWEKPWLLGYLSGVARGANLDFMKGVDPDKLYVLIDKACTAEPSKNLGQIAEDVAQALVRAMEK